MCRGSCRQKRRRDRLQISGLLPLLQGRPDSRPRRDGHPRMLVSLVLIRVQM